MDPMWRPPSPPPSSATEIPLIHQVCSSAPRALALTWFVSLWLQLIVLRLHHPPGLGLQLTMALPRQIHSFLSYNHFTSQQAMARKSELSP